MMFIFFSISRSTPPILITLMIPTGACYDLEAQCSNYLMRLFYVTKQSHLCSMMSEQPIESFYIVKNDLPSTMLLHSGTINTLSTFKWTLLNYQVIHNFSHRFFISIKCIS